MESSNGSEYDCNKIIRIRGFSCIEPKKIKIVNTSKFFQIFFGRQMRIYTVIELAMS